MDLSRIFRFSSLLIAVLMAPFLTGCAGNDELVESNYGESVRHMIAAQTAYPNRDVTGLDGQKAALTLQRYRTDVARPQEVDRKALGTSQATANLEQQK